MLFRSGSNVDYDKWQVEVQDDWNANLLGTFSFKYISGGFINDRSVEVQDFNHFPGNRFSFSTDYLSAFQLPEYYIFSNQSVLFNAIYTEHHFNGFITNKIPGFKKLNWFLVAGARALWYDQNTYVEWNFGLENILKVLRFDIVYGAKNGSLVLPEFRIGSRIQLSESID